jgi:hypothetical protein
MTIVAGAAEFITLVWFGSVVRLRVWRQWHHFWLGVALLHWFPLVGLGVMADDALQHAVQLRWPEFRSPLHLLYRYTLYALIVHELDKRFRGEA